MARAAAITAMAGSAGRQAAACVAMDAAWTTCIGSMRGRPPRGHGPRRRRHPPPLRLQAALHCTSMAARLTACSTPCLALQLKLGDQILAEEKHLPLYKVRGGAGGATAAAAGGAAGSRAAGLHAALPCRRRAVLPSAYASPLNLQELDGQAEHTPQVAMPKPVPCKNYPKNVQELEEKFQVEYIAGGATQNSARVAQWMLQVRLVLLLLGAVWCRVCGCLGAA